MDDLALQIGLVDDVEVDDAQRADAGSSQVQQGGRAESPGANAEHLRVLQPLLARHPDVRDDQMPGIALDLIDRELGGRLDERRQGHGFTPVRHHLSAPRFNERPLPGIPAARTAAAPQPGPDQPGTESVTGARYNSTMPDSTTPGRAAPAAPRQHDPVPSLPRRRPRRQPL